MELIWQRLPCITNRHNKYEKFCNLDEENARICWQERAEMNYPKGEQISPQICDQYLNSRHQMDDTKQVPHWEPTVLWWPPNLVVIWHFLLGACASRHTFLYKEISCSILQILGARDFRKHDLLHTVSIYPPNKSWGEFRVTGFHPPLQV